ncbi:MAG: DUF2189 domain-containing protein [Acetobacteraceae bacterium]|nr:DUF2189 domain-containing protein [Acetobacteraceae bacterium]
MAPAPAARPKRVRQIATDRPWFWLTRGWQDFQANKAVGLAYGAALAIFGWMLAWVMFEWSTIWAILPATAGFFILGPLVAAGLYEVSRRREAGEPAPTLAEAAQAFRRNGAQIAMMGVLLMLIHLFWVRIAGLLFFLFFGLNTPPVADLPFHMLRHPDLLPFLVIGTGFGFVLASASFAVTAVAIPMLVDRPEVTFLEAVTVSIQAVLENWRPMLLWAGLIVVFTGLALVPFFLGLLLALPLLGHATWHAYRDIVVR